MRCAGSVQACAGLADTSSEHADEGTAAHDLAAQCLHRGAQPHEFLGAGIVAGSRSYTVDSDMAEFVGRYVDYVREEAAAASGEVHVECRLPIGHITGEEGAHGTADAVILAPLHRALIVCDLKYGRGVPVQAEGNEQLMLYAAAALDLHDPEGLVHGIARVTLVIHQPRLGSVSEWDCSADGIRDFAEQVREGAEFTRHPQARRNPSEKACRWCLAKATCPALAEQVQQEVGAGFDDLAGFNRELTEAGLVKRAQRSDAVELGLALEAVELVELWCKAVRAEAERRLLAGEPLPGFKLVQGRRGARRWADDAAAEQMLKAMRLKHDEMYDYSVISAPKAERLHKAGVIGPKQWPRLQALITQPEGAPHVAPASDKRPAIDPRAAASDFDDVSQPAAEPALA